MKFNGFIVAIVVLAALGAALYWSNHHMPSETTQASAETPPKILTLNEADINKIDIKKKGGEEVRKITAATGRSSLRSRWVPISLPFPACFLLYPPSIPIDWSKRRQATSTSMV